MERVELRRSDSLKFRREQGAQIIDDINAIKKANDDIGGMLQDIKNMLQDISQRITTLKKDDPARYG